MEQWEIDTLAWALLSIDGAALGLDGGDGDGDGDGDEQSQLPPVSPTPSPSDLSRPRRSRRSNWLERRSSAAWAANVKFPDSGA